MADIFNQIDEQLRQDRLQRLWQQYKLFIVAGLGAFMVLVAGVSYYQWSKTQTAKQAGYDFVQAVNRVQSDVTNIALIDALADLGRVLIERHVGYGYMAMEVAAQHYAQQGEWTKATTLYQDIAKQGAGNRTTQFSSDQAYLLAIAHHQHHGNNRQAELDKLAEFQDDGLKDNAQSAALLGYAKLVQADMALAMGQKKAAIAILDGMAQDDDGTRMARAYQSMANELRHLIAE